MMKQRLDAARDRVEGRVEDEMKRIDLLDEMQNVSTYLPKGVVSVGVYTSILFFKFSLFFVFSFIFIFCFVGGGVVFVLFVSFL